MIYRAITREGNKDGIIVKGLQDPVVFKDEIPGFVKRNKDDDYRIVFVGMCTVDKGDDQILIYSLPKYFPEEQCNEEHWDEIKSCLIKICKVVEKLRAAGKDFDDTAYSFDPYEQGDRSKNVSRWDLAEFIIEDYVQNGLYVKDQTETVRGGVGRTNWAKTVSRIDPIFQRNTLIYLEQMNNHHIIDENDFMSIIHANVVNQCLDFLSILSDGIEHIETDPLGDTLDMYSPVINSESTYVFKERDINLFKALEAWCEKTRFYKNYAGVTCFDRVWEWVNDSVWGNIEHPESDNPIYHIGNTDYEGKGDAIPDTIRIEKDIEDKCTTYIFDSKYYTIDKTYPQKGKEEKKIVGFPSNSDIVKQVAYLKLIKSQYGEGDYFNSFLLPEYHERCSSDEKELLIVPESDWFRRIGYVLPGKFSLPISPKTKQDGEEEKVGLVFVDPDKLYDRYLKGYHASDEELKRTTAPMLL